MIGRYKVPAHSFLELCRTAANVPDRMYADTMGRDYPTLLEGWTRNLAAHVDMIAAEAWAAGAQWALEMATRPIELVVTPEKYKEWEQKAKDAGS